MTERDIWDRPRRNPIAAPPPRPRWMVVLVALMLVSGARLFLSALMTLQTLQGRPTTVAVEPLSAVDDEALSRTFEAAMDRAYPRAAATYAAAKLVVALMLLFAVAAVLTHDRRGRRAAMIAAWAGILYNVGNAAFMLIVVRRGALAAAPVLAEALVKRHGAAAPAISEVTAMVGNVMVVIPVLLALFGIAFSLVILAFFGGRRGRVFYGLEPQTTNGA
jgi:hypothetical protein